MVAFSNVSCAVCDDGQGIELACNHLFSLGHRRIAFVGRPEHLTTARRRKSAYTRYCRSRNLRPPGEFTQAGVYTTESGRVAGLKLLSLKNRPSAIVAANDMMAFGLVEAARELKLDVPREVSIVGFDDLTSSTERYPMITTVHQPVVEMAARAAQLLVSSMDWKPPVMAIAARAARAAQLLVSSMETGHKPDQRVVLPVHLVRRASTDRPGT